MQLWSPAHLAAIAVTALAAVLLVAGARRLGDSFAAPAGRVLALVLLAGFAGEQLAYALRGDWTAEFNLPLQLTDDRHARRGRRALATRAAARRAHVLLGAERLAAGC